MPDTRAHPEEGELIRYCDGELRAGEAARVAGHLQACWDCRTRADDLKQAIAEYVRYRRDVLEPAQPGPPQPWRDLHAEFARMEVREPAWKRILQRRSVWLIACAATAGTGILWYRANQPKPAAPVAIVRPAAAPIAVRTAPARPAAREKAVGPDDELRVIAALNRIGGDLGDPIEVVRTSKGIMVTCSGLRAARLSEVRAALDGMSGVVMQVSAKPAVTPSGSPLEVVGAPHAADNEQLADSLLKHSETMMARAHALRALAVRFPPAVEASMRDETRASLADIRKAHEAALSREVSALTASLEPMLGQLPATSAVQEDWQAHAMRLFADAAEVDRLLGAKFAGHGTAGAGGGSAELAAALARLKANAF